MSIQLTTKDVRRIARRTIEALDAIGYKHCCLFGSAACCMLWGNAYDRVPGDLDIVVFTNDDPEVIKEALDNTHSRFFRKAGKNGPYNVLWYLICGNPEFKIKVDILIPGKNTTTVGIPRIHPDDIWYRYGDIPVMPLLPLLILKIQGWRDHRASSKKWHSKKVPQDVKDIEMLLSMVDDEEDLRDYSWIHANDLEWFMKKANKLVKTYIHRFPNSSLTALTWSWN